MSNPLLIIGVGGQLSRALRTLCPDAIFLDRAQADLAHPHTISDALEKYDPSAVINAAAYTQVDNAEKEEKLAAAINAQSPAAMAIYCMGRKIPLVHISTDYVFNGEGETPWHEDDAPAPLNAYGRTKLAGEDAITQVGGRYLIFRTSWLYDAHGKNFFNTILRLAAEREELRIIDDQHGAPTYVPHLAQGILEALEFAMEEKTFSSGVYHLCSGGVTSWYGFATAILERARRRGMAFKARTLTPIPASDYPLPAKRPYNSRLDCAKALSVFSLSLPPWQDGLSACMKEKYESI